MAKILCHAVYQKAELFQIAPTRSDIAEEYVFYLEKCAVCLKPVVEIVRMDIWGNVPEPVRLKSKNIKKFLESMIILWKPDRLFRSGKSSGGIALCYNEYGIQKKCYDNLSSMKIGKIETDPLLDLRNLKEDLKNTLKAS